MLRNRKKTVISAVTELDAFPKVPESYVETSASGGTVSVISFLLMALFIVSEINYYSTSKFKFKYGVDTEFDKKLKINVDMTVAMPCDTIGADILDVTNQNADKFGQLNEEPTWFELSPAQQVHWDSLKHVNAYFRDEFHSIQDLLWGSGYAALFGSLPKRESTPTTEPDACRLYGTFVVNKVAGNFHITAGKSIPYPRGHAHLAAFLSAKDYNYTHRIERLSFGDTAPGVINPLDTEQKITTKNYQLYQYYLQVVPTDVRVSKFWGSTYQYAVTEQEREVDHEGGSHGVPGIYFKYDMSPINVRVSEEREPFWQFLVRLCGIVGGIFATSGIVNAFVEFVVNLLCCWTLPAKRPTHPTSVHQMSAQLLPEADTGGPEATSHCAEKISLLPNA